MAPHRPDAALTNLRKSAALAFANAPRPRVPFTGSPIGPPLESLPAPILLPPLVETANAAFGEGGAGAHGADGAGGAAASGGTTAAGLVGGALETAAGSQ